MIILNKKINGYRWAFNQECTQCGWHRTPEMKWTIGNTLKPPHICPKCGKPLSLRKLTCPKCG
ncbi:MAG: zinc ribbon domain-containing protein, partial [Sedimentisphaerales bacterium]|nr:zinc ribbon domain-containing protein [Sedimentisphaerales bacterium]